MGLGVVVKRATLLRVGFVSSKDCRAIVNGGQRFEAKGLPRKIRKA
jgi:hypothetical protein